MEALGIDIKLLIAQLVNFVLFAVVFTKFMYKPFKVYLQKNHHEEQERTRLLHDLQEKDEKLQEREKKVLIQARDEAAKIVKEAEDNAKTKAADIIRKAEEEAQALKQRTQNDLDDERQKLYDEVKKKIIHTSEVMTAAVLKDFLSEKQQKDIIEHVKDTLKGSQVYEN